MRALLVCAAPVPGSEALLPRLAADVDLVVAVDGGGALCLTAGVVPDAVVGDFDSLSPGDLQRLLARGVEPHEYPADKDASDLELAIVEVRRRGATSITVTAALAGRLDHTLAALGVVCSARDLVPHMVEPELEAWVLSPEGRESIVLSGADATLSVLAFGAPAVVSAEGVIWKLDSARLTPESSLGLSNRIDSEGSARISVHEGVALVLAPKVAGRGCVQGT